MLDQKLVSTERVKALPQTDDQAGEIRWNPQKSLFYFAMAGNHSRWTLRWYASLVDTQLLSHIKMAGILFGLPWGIGRYGRPDRHDSTS